MTDLIDALADLSKGLARGGKYFRRTPTGNPERPWRYYYTREEYEREHGSNAHVAGREAAQAHRESRGGEVKLTKKQLAHELRHGTYSIISAGRNPAHPDEGKLPVDHPSFELRHQRLRRQLQFRGFKFTEVVGHYGGAEKSFLVYHADAPKKKGDEKALMVHHRSTSEFAAIRKLGAEHNQDSVIHSHAGKHEMHYTVGEHAGEHLKGEGHKVLPHAEDYFTHAPTKKSATKFALNFDWEKRHPQKEALLKSRSALDSRHVRTGEDEMDAITALGSLSKSLRKAEAGATAAFHKYKAKHAKPGGGWEYEYEHTGTGEATRKDPVEHFHEVMRPLHSGAPTKDKTPHPNAVAHALRGMIDHASTLKTAKAKKELAQHLDRHLDAARTHLTNMRNYHQRDRSGEHYRSPKDESRKVTGSDVSAATTVRDHLDQAKGLIKEAGMDPEKKKAADAKKEAASQKASEKYQAKKTGDESHASKLHANYLRGEVDEAKRAHEHTKKQFAEQRAKGVSFDDPASQGAVKNAHERHGVDIATKTHRYREHLKAHEKKFGSLPEGHKMVEEHERYAHAIAEQKHGQQRLALSRTGKLADPIDALEALSKSAGGSHKYVKRTGSPGAYKYEYGPGVKTPADARAAHKAAAVEAQVRAQGHERRAHAMIEQAEKTHGAEGALISGGMREHWPETTKQPIRDTWHNKVNPAHDEMQAHLDMAKKRNFHLPHAERTEKPDMYEGHPNATHLRSSDASSKADHTTYTLNRGEGHGSGHGTASEHEAAARLHEKAAKLKRDAGMPSYAELHEHHAEQHRKAAATLRPIGREAWEQERAGKLEPMKTEKSMSNEKMVESTPALRKAFRGLDGPEKLAKGLYKFGNMSANAKPIAIPDEYLVAYLDSFIEEATEHETCERLHAMDAMTMGPPPGSPVDAIAQFVFNELVSYMACNENLLRAVKLVNASRDYVSARISDMGLLKPMASHAHDHGDFMQGYMYSEDQEQGYVGKSFGPGTTLDEESLLKAVMPIRAAHAQVDGAVTHMQADDPMEALGNFHRAQRGRVAAMYGEGPTKFDKNAGEPLPKR